MPLYVATKLILSGITWKCAHNKLQLSVASTMKESNICSIYPWLMLERDEIGDPRFDFVLACKIVGKFINC